MKYETFVDAKSHDSQKYGFKPIWMPKGIIDFQESSASYAIEKGRAALFEDCGLGKTIQELTWAENVYRHTNKPVLILTPLAVARQFVTEGEKFGVECTRDPKKKCGIKVTNFEQLHKFNSNDFSGVAVDESGILKNFDGATKTAITEFLKKMPFRLLASATPAPNDSFELGTSSEALGHLGYMDMLAMFFRSTQNSLHPMSSLSTRYGGAIFAEAKFRFKPHAEKWFWRWVCSWARAFRKPSDLGFSDEKFILPELIENTFICKRKALRDGYLFNLPSVGLKEEREERRATLIERCEMATEKVVRHKGASISWCALNDEADLLEKLIPESKQVSGSQSDEEKEETFIAFEKGQLEKLVIKPKIGAWGLNFQFCNHMTWFVSHSYEQYHQAVRRLYRFGQKKPVTVDIIASDGEEKIISNLKRKSIAADKMFTQLVEQMNNAKGVEHKTDFKNKMEAVSWLK